MYWSVAYNTSLEYMWVIALDGDHITLEPHHIGFINEMQKTFIWYELEETYLEAVKEPHWKEFGKIYNNEGLILLDGDE